jgi:hypothetical protein
MPELDGTPMQFRSKQIPPPKHWEEFEDLCHALFKRVWRDPLAQKHGRRGQAQHGVDVFGSLDNASITICGVQCKGKDRHYGAKAEWQEVLAELAKAEHFVPALHQWIFATTAPSEGSLQRNAAELSVSRVARGQSAVTVLGWEEIVALMAEHPAVIDQFYPEYSDQWPQALLALEGLRTRLDATLDQLAQAEEASATPSAAATGDWEPLSFGQDRGLVPALLGLPLGPADAGSCPRLIEVGAVQDRLRMTGVARLIGEPGAGKSICAYQVAGAFAEDGFEVYRLRDPKTPPASAEPEQGRRQLYLIDDAHLLPELALARLEERAIPSRCVLSIHNAVVDADHRAAIAVDPRRAVKTIASALRADLAATLDAVRLADDRVGRRMMDDDIVQRLDQAEANSGRPWQFCFVLGGGWRRAKHAADAARVARADGVLAAVAVHQIAFRDARATPSDIQTFSEPLGVTEDEVHSALKWLKRQRLILDLEDCRTPHQRFVGVVLKHILNGRDRAGQHRIARLVDAVLQDPSVPLLGLRLLMHELRFDHDVPWRHLLDPGAVSTAIARCWSAGGSDRNAAALALTDLSGFADGSTGAVVRPYAATFAAWLSRPDEGAYGCAYLLNQLSQDDRALAERIVHDSDPRVIAHACSEVTPENAYGLGDLLGRIALATDPTFRAAVLDSLDRAKLFMFAAHTAFEERAFIFCKFCASVRCWDEALALDMAEHFVPTAQRVLARDPIDGFHQISHDLASTVLRVFDVLDIYTGALKPTARQWSIARRMCRAIDPLKVAAHVSDVKPRDFQSAAFLLHFLHRTVPRIYNEAVRAIDWQRLGRTIGDEWSNLEHETEVLLATLGATPPAIALVQSFMKAHAGAIELLPPRLMLMDPEMGIEHIASGRRLRLARHGHVEWEFGEICLAMLAVKRPNLIEAALKPYTREIAHGLSAYRMSSARDAAGFIQYVVASAPRAWAEILARVEAGEDELAQCLAKGRSHRRTAALLIESALAVEVPLTETAQRLRRRFPRASTPEPIQDLDSGHRRKRRKR